MPVVGDLSIKGGNNRNVIQASIFAPLYETADDVIFGDVRAMKHLPHLKKKKSVYKQDTYEGNFGIGYRHAMSEELVLGATAYYDIRKSGIGKGHFTQATLNAHMLTPTWHINANAYVPVGKTKKSKKDLSFTGNAIVENRDVFLLYKDKTIIEKAATGFDLKVSNTIPNTDVRIAPLVYYFKANKSFAGGGVEAKWQAYDNLSFEASYTYDKARKSNMLAGIRVSLGSRKLKSRTSKDGLFSTRVERDLDIVTDASSSLSNDNKKILQNNMMAVSNDDLRDVDNAASANKNTALITKLKQVYQDQGTLLLVDNNNEFKLADATKIGGTDLTQKVQTVKQAFAAQVQGGATIDQLNTSAARTSDPLQRQVEMLAIQELHQATDSNSIRVAAKNNQVLTDDHSQRLADLFALYAKSGPTANKTFTINLPGYPNAVIERAGTMILVKVNGEVYSILGTDSHGVQPWSAWFSGQAEQKDATIYNTILRETFEESAGSVAIRIKEFTEAINDGRFFYSPHHKILTIVYPDTANRYSAAQFTANLARIKQDANIVHSMKEMISYHNVPLNELANMHARVSVPGRHNHTVYRVNTDNGQHLSVEGHYARAFGSSINGITALNKAAAKF